MRIAVLTLPWLLLCGSCSLFSSTEKSEFTPPNSLMADEIESRVQQIPYQHGDELLQNLLWLSQTGESTIPSLLSGLKNESPKIRSSCAWALGRIRDRRTIPYLQTAVKDTNETVRFEVARTLLTLGDIQTAPVLIEGLDSEKKEVRYLCHEALKSTTGRDFGYDHLSENESQRHMAVLGWRQWWSDYSGDGFFASSYQERFSLQPAQPMGEGQPQMQDQAPMPMEPMPGTDPQQNGGGQSDQPQNQMPQNNEPQQGNEPNSSTGGGHNG
ncbi:MAG: HEAT repeat domain-containing protein [Planctomycetota bacterium]